MKFSLSAALVVTQILVIILELFGAISWPWYILFIPIWLLIAGWVLMFIFVIALISMMGLSIDELIKEIKDEEK